MYDEQQAKVLERLFERDGGKKIRWICSEHKRRREKEQRDDDDDEEDQLYDEWNKRDFSSKDMQTC